MIGFWRNTENSIKRVNWENMILPKMTTSAINQSRQGVGLDRHCIWWMARYWFLRSRSSKSIRRYKCVIITCNIHILQTMFTFIITCLITTRVLWGRGLLWLLLVPTHRFNNWSPEKLCHLLWLIQQAMNEISKLDSDLLTQLSYSI